MPVAAPRSPNPRSLLFDIPTQIELSAGEPDDAIQSGLYFGWQVAASHQSLGFIPDRVQRLHEVSLFQLAGVVGHGCEGWMEWSSGRCQLRGLGRRKLRCRAALAHLLPPHRVIESGSLQQIRM